MPWIVKHCLAGVLAALVRRHFIVVGIAANLQESEGRDEQAPGMLYRYCPEQSHTSSSAQPRSLERGGGRILSLYGARQLNRATVCRGVVPGRSLDGQSLGCRINVVPVSSGVKV